jgi:hypothetical protein
MATSAGDADGGDDGDKCFLGEDSDDDDDDDDDDSSPTSP